MRRPIPLIAVSLALVGVGCAERALGPGDVSGSYVVVRYDGAPPPRQYLDQGGCVVTVYGGDLTLGADGSYALDLQRGRQCPGAQALQDVGLSRRGTFRFIGRMLRFADTAGGEGLAGDLIGTHVRVSVPQPAGLTPAAVTAEFAAGSSEGGIRIAEPTGPGQPGLPPLPHDTTYTPIPSDTSGIVIIVKP